MSSQRVSPPAMPFPLQPRNTPAPPHPFGADARCVPCKVLKNAIRSVLTESGKRPRSTTSDEVSELLGLVASAIHLAWFTASPAVPVRPKVDPRIHSALGRRDRKSTRLNSSHSQISYAVFCLKKKKRDERYLR